MSNANDVTIRRKPDLLRPNEKNYSEIIVLVTEINERTQTLNPNLVENMNTGIVKRNSGEIKIIIGGKILIFLPNLRKENIFG